MLDPCVRALHFNGVIPRRVEDFGAIGDGKTDDTAAFAKAVANCNYVMGTPGSTYLVNELVITNKTGFTLDGQGAALVFNRGGYGIIVSSCTWSTFTNWQWLGGVSGSVCLVVDGGNQNTFRNLRFNNVPRCIWLRSSTLADTTRETSLSNIYANGITEWAVWVGGANKYGVHDITYSDFYLTGDANGKTADQSVGMLFDFSNMAGQKDLKGNHRISNVLSLGFATGFKFNECNEAFVSNVQIDGCVYYGLHITGSTRMMFSNLWSSTIAKGPSIYIGNRTTETTISNAYCYNNGPSQLSLVVNDNSSLFLDACVRLVNGKQIDSSSKVYAPSIQPISQ